MILKIRNMVCRNCISALQQALEQSGFKVCDIGLGYAEIESESLTADQTKRLQEKLHELGFELIEDPATALSEKVKVEVISHIESIEPCRYPLSRCIAEATGKDYKTVSRIFSAVEGQTIEKFYIKAKIEKAKELLSYGDLTLTEIAYRLGYSGVAFLSRQFKQETGMTPTAYQKSRHERKALTDL